MTQLVRYKSNNNSVCYVSLLSLLTEILELGICPPGLEDVWHTTNSAVQIIFLSTTYFTVPQAPFYNINSLPDPFRCSQKCQIKLSSCGLSLAAAEHILLRACPCRTANTPGCLRPAGTNMARSCHSSAWLSPAPSCQQAQNKGAKLQISLQMLLQLW